MLVNLRLLANTLIARDEVFAARRLPVVGTVALPVAEIVDPVARMRIANALAGHDLDACRLALRDLGISSPRRQIIAAVELALLLQESERPVLVMVSNPLRDLFWAAGVAGVEAVPARRQRPSLPRHRPGSGAGWTPPPRFEIGSLMTPLTPEATIAALKSGVVPEADCACPGCAGISVEGRVKRPATHNVLDEVKGAARLDGLAPDERCELLRGRLREARRLGWELVAGGVIGRWPDATDRLEGALDEMRTSGVVERPVTPRLRRVS